MIAHYYTCSGCDSLADEKGAPEIPLFCIHAGNQIGASLLAYTCCASEERHFQGAGTTGECCPRLHNFLGNARTFCSLSSNLRIVHLTQLKTITFVTPQSLAGLLLENHSVNWRICKFLMVCGSDFLTAMESSQHHSECFHTFLFSPIKRL